MRRVSTIYSAHPKRMLLVSPTLDDLANEDGWDGILVQSESKGFQFGDVPAAAVSCRSTAGVNHDVDDSCRRLWVAPLAKVLLSSDPWLRERAAIYMLTALGGQDPLALPQVASAIRDFASSVSQRAD